MIETRVNYLSDILKNGLRLNPEKSAITSSDVNISFSELDRITNALASEMTELGVSVGDRVVVFAEKSPATVVTAIAIWKAGAIYVPVDTDIPDARVSLIFEKIRPSLIVYPSAEQCRPDSVFMNVKRYVLKPYGEYLSAVCDFNAAAIDMNEDSIAYILHTSGTTGEPKGAAIPHRAVVSFFENYSRYLRMDHRSSSINLGPFYFDITFQDTFMPIYLGGQSYIFESFIAAPLVFRQLEQQKITHFFVVAPVLTMLTQYKKMMLNLDLSSLNVLITGAEVCGNDVLHAWKELKPELRVINSYGPTEVNSVSIVYEIMNVDEGRSGFYPIGKPIGNVFTCLLDENDLMIEEVGKTGELLIGGGQLMTGYWTGHGYDRARIINVNGQEYYRSGDLAYRDKNNDLCFAGRRDDEVKISGRRINLLEIQNAFHRIAGVKSAAVSVHNDVLGKSIIAAVFAEIHDQEFCCHIKVELENILPKYMVPEHIGILGEAINNTRGKTDKKLIFDKLAGSIKVQRSSFYYFGDGEFSPVAIPV